MTLKKVKAVKDGIKKDKILKAATALFSKSGYAQTSIRDITRKSKVSIGLLYFYYKNKKDILKAIFMRLKPVFSDLHNEHKEKHSFAEYFRLLGKSLIDFSVSNLGFNLLLLNESMKDRELSNFFYEQFKTEISIIAQKFSEYSDRENLRKVDCEKIAISLVSTTYSLAVFNRVFKDNFNSDFLDNMLENIVDVSINGLVQK